MNHKSLLTISSALLLSLGTGKAAIIDNFNSDTALVNTGTPGPATFAANPTNTIGGFRTLQILGYPADLDPTSPGATLEVVGGLLGHSQNVGTSGRSRITWDGDGSLNADLTDGGSSDRLELSVVDLDQGPITLTFVIRSGANSATRSLSGLGLGTHQFAFSSFSGDTSVFANAESIELTIEAPTSSDLGLDFIRTTTSDVPEPSTYLAVGGALLAFGARRFGRKG